MFYGKDFGPQTSYQALSVLHAQLGTAYSIIAQYEQEERERESKRLRDLLDEQRAHKEALALAADMVQQLADEIPHGDHVSSVLVPDECVSCKVRSVEYQLRGKMMLRGKMTRSNAHDES